MTCYIVIRTRAQVLCAAIYTANAYIYISKRSSHTSTSPRGVRAESKALVVVAAEGLAVDEGERGDDEDDAGRCRSDARGQPSTAFVAAGSVGGTVARAGVDIARLREKSFRECLLLGLLHLWENKDSSLYTNALVYSPP